MEPVAWPADAAPEAVWLAEDAAEAGDASFGLATTVSVRDAVLMTIICWRSCSSRVTVLLLGIDSIASAAPDAPDTEGPITQAATETAATANVAMPATGRMTPLRRTKRLPRRVLVVPVRCRDKAILPQPNAPDGASGRVDRWV